jgi:hypothetical protein
MRFVKPRNVIMVTVAATVVFSCSAVGVKGEGGVAMLSLLYLPKPTSSLRFRSVHPRRGTILQAR